MLPFLIGIPAVAVAYGVLIGWATMPILLPLMKRLPWQRGQGQFWRIFPDNLALASPFYVLSRGILHDCWITLLWCAGAGVFLLVLSISLAFALFGALVAVLALFRVLVVAAFLAVAVRIIELAVGHEVEVAQQGAVFQLPCDSAVSTDTGCSSGVLTASYQIWARALGTPGGTTTITTCASTTTAEAT